jgi:hypothetical protein
MRRPINVLVPYEIAASKQANIQITTDAGSAQTGPLQVVPAQPALFTILNSDGSVNSSSNPAAQDSLVSIFVSVSYTLPSTLVPIFGQQTVTPKYAGGVPGTAINMLRVAVKLPAILESAWGGSVAIQVGSAQSATIPLYVSASP